MTLGAAMHRHSSEVVNGSPIDTRHENLRWAAGAEIGSEELLLALERQFLLFSRQHGITMADAQLFCMNSETPR